MVDPYATTLGGLTVAVDGEHFLLEDPVSNSVLSLRPAVTFDGDAQPSACGCIKGFLTADDRIEVTWETLEGIVATSVLEAEPEDAEPDEESGLPARLRLRLRVENQSGEPIGAEALHPLFFPAEGPGACALGLEDLRTLASQRADMPPSLMRLHGEGLSSTVFGAWFAPAGSPMLLLAALEGNEPAPRFLFTGARGKMLSLSAAWPVQDSELAPGARVETASLLLVVGNRNIQEELEGWAGRLGAAGTPVQAPEFDPSGEVTELEPDDREEAEFEEDFALAEGEEPAPDEVQEFEGDSAPVDASEGVTPGLTLAHRASSFRRAMRNTRAFQETGQGIWPRWAAGRRHEPLSGAGARTRGYWRVECPLDENA